jgi:hypothetical protein
MRSPNYLGIIAGSVAFWLFGAIWYALLFGNAWVAAVGKTQADLGAAMGYWPYLISLVAGLFIAYGCDNMLWHYEHAGASKGAQVGLLAGVCFAAASMVIAYSYAARGLTLMLIDGGYLIIGFIITGAVVGALRAWALSRGAARAA